MNKDYLIQIFNEQVSGKNYFKGQRIVENDLVADIKVKNSEEMIYIKGNVISESLFNEYIAKVELDVLNGTVISTYCTCKDYEENELKKENYACKHICAAFYKSIEQIEKLPFFYENNKNDISKSKTGEKLLNLLIGEDANKAEIKIDVYINRNFWDHNISAEFKIGIKEMNSNSLYIVKDINHFLLAIDNDIAINYGKNFILNMKEQKLSMKDKTLIDFIHLIKKIEGGFSSRKSKPIIDGKQLNIPEYLVKQFFKVIKNHRVFLAKGFLSRIFETEVLEERPPIEFDLKLIKNEYVLKAPYGMPILLGSENNVFFYGTEIYMPDDPYLEKIEPYITALDSGKVVTFNNSLENKLLRKLIPRLNYLSSKLTLSQNILEKIVKENCEFKFYFDKDGDKILLITKVKYGEYEFNIFEDCNEKIVYREKTEEKVLALLTVLGFLKVNNKFYLDGEDDFIFRFFKTEIEKLHKFGEVFYSENFKGIKSLGSNNISAEIRAGKYDYFEFAFKIDNVNDYETTNILRAFRDNLKYYKLENGEFLDLEQLELKKLLKLVDAVSEKEIKDNSINIPKNKSMYIDEYIEENNMRYIKGKNELETVKEKIKNIHSLEFNEENNQLVSLRNYQKIGVNWFKTLDYLGFGGILGDEMGLGKTLQTIAFLLSNKESKTLIVVPTSLVYNWAKEFEKFAPSIKVQIVNGSKNERVNQLGTITNYDVLITTYNLLKLDIEIYKKIEFDYFILDEAQNIKNSHSQNAKAVKEIESKRKFALTGTPIENSLMELWSIFDFIMPGYLYDEKRFSVRYHKQLKEDPVVIEDLNRLIKPFILRRKKKDVIKELPDKIENTIFVSLTNEEKKVYGTYAKYVMDIIEKKVEDDEFAKSRIEILVYITKLRQLCLDPSVVMENYNGKSSKIDALLELLNESIEEGHKILVFSQFTSVLKNIGERLKLEGVKYSYLDGTIPSEKRMQMVNDFNEGDNKVFLISLKAGGTGLNLTSADIVIHFDPWWNPAVEDQATDRAHRIGQEKVVEVIKIIAKDTIEEKIISLQKEKKKLIESILDDELYGNNGLISLKDDEILNLFRN